MSSGSARTAAVTAASPNIAATGALRRIQSLIRTISTTPIMTVANTTK
jgi:hypothetical protein